MFFVACYCNNSKHLCIVFVAALDLLCVFVFFLSSQQHGGWRVNMKSDSDDTLPFNCV